MIDDPELLQLFKAESEEHLARLDDGLLRLEKLPADAGLLEEVFRESHSLKGAARMLGLARVEAAAHGMESVLNAARRGEASLTPQTMTRMNAALVDLRGRVQEALADMGGAAPSPALPREREREQDGAHRERERERDDVHGEQPPSSTPSGNEQALSPASGGELERGPPPPPTTASAVSPAPTSSSIDAAAAAATSSSAASAPAGKPFRIETVRVETRKLDDLLTQVGELSVVQGRAQHRLALMEELLEQWLALERGERGAGAPARTGAKGAARTRFGLLLKQARDALFDDSARIEATVGLLEDQVHGIRLLPLATVFALFPRMVHDLAGEQGKEVELALEGGDITVDKRILEEMKDPLMHLIRNTIDHGIEPPAEREQLGKPRGGTIRLSARRENSHVLLEVADDGRGLDPAAIRQTALQRGLHDEATLAAMTPAQLQQLVFTPGFSTSARVTALSGRGVGLDVVRVNVERLKGGIRLDSAAGRGLTVQLRLPLSLATTRLLLANAGGRLFGLPIECVHTSRRVREAEIFTLEGHLAILLDGQPVIAARLADLLELPAPSPTLPREGGGSYPPLSPGGRGAGGEGVLACIVIQAGDGQTGQLGLLVDELLTEEEVVPKPLGAPLKRVRNVSALAMLASGEICAVLNPADLLRSAWQAGAPLRSEEREIRREAAKPAVLLVEDSALIRAMQQRILVDGGYEVVTAVDGADALIALGGRRFAAVVSDIMMPNMDGLALTRRIRAEPRYKELPVILVTTLASNEDKQRGLEAGASAYIPKPSFDQRVLLDTLKRLVVT
jgi:two-component system chemotaxis sensor kinase CheA